MGAVRINAMVLEKTRHEIFCQNVARGKSQAEAYVIAGYKKSDANAATLAARPEIIGRIEEIKGLAAMRAQVSVDRVVAVSVLLDQPIWRLPPGQTLEC